MIAIRTGLVALLVCFSQLSFGDELVIIGQTYPIKEKNLLVLIQEKLSALQENGEIEKLKQKMINHVEVYANSPTPVSGLSSAKEDREYFYNPSIKLSKNIVDANGNILVKKGAVVNPLDNVNLTQPLLFFDATIPNQRALAKKFLKKYQGKIKLILTNGRIVDLMNEWNFHLYFDQKGAITTQLQIKHTPALVTQSEKRLRIQEFKLP